MSNEHVDVFTRLTRIITHSAVNVMQETHVMNLVKHQLCYVSQDFLGDLELCKYVCLSRCVLLLLCVDSQIVIDTQQKRPLPHPTRVRVAQRQHAAARLHQGRGTQNCHARARCTWVRNEKSRTNTMV